MRKEDWAAYREPDPDLSFVRVALERGRGIRPHYEINYTAPKGREDATRNSYTARPSDETPKDEWRGLSDWDRAALFPPPVDLVKQMEKDAEARRMGEELGLMPGQSAVYSK